MRCMGRMAPEILVDAAAIEQLESLILQLPSQAQVRIRTREGSIVCGTVTERPALQLFEDARGDEGINAVVRLDDPQVPPWTIYLWLTDVRSVDQLDTRK
jgi:Protein of unknown function (DUF3247)